MNDILEILTGAAAGLLIGLIILSVFTLFFRWLWNTTVPDVFGLKSLTFWQAFRVLLLAAILFGGGTTIFERGHEVVPDDETEQLSG